jgi:hypothetical protein
MAKHLSLSEGEGPEQLADIPNGIELAPETAPPASLSSGVNQELPSASPPWLGWLVWWVAMLIVLITLWLIYGHRF